MRDLFYCSFERFTASERDNILNGVSERNLCARLGMYLEDERRERKMSAHRDPRDRPAVKRIRGKPRSYAEERSPGPRSRPRRLSPPRETRCLAL